MKKIVLKYTCRECGKYISLDVVPGVIRGNTLRLYNTLFEESLCIKCNSKTSVSCNSCENTAVTIN